MIRRATPKDLPEIDAFLSARAETSMFPLTNLRNHGLDGDAPKSMRIWAIGDPVRGLISISREGMIMPQLDLADAKLAAGVLAGRQTMGIAGPTVQVHAMLDALRLANAPMRMLHDEPHFLLSLDDLIMPKVEGYRLVPVAACDRALITRWRADYDVEIMEGTPEQARLDAERTVDNWLAADSHRVLMQDDRPVALTGFNASLPEIVQIGGVWTPPDLRGRGLARRAVALHLAEARAAGVRRATLFAASDMAARAYTAIGFRRIGEFSLCLFRTPQEIAP